MKTHKRVTITVDERLLEKAKKCAGSMVPFSRWVESLITKEIEQIKRS